MQMCLPKSGLELEGDPALINPLLDSIYINIQTYQTRGKSRLTFWDFYSKFLHYNLFVYAKMYGKINCRIDKKGEKSVVKGPVCNSIGLIFFDGDEGDPSLISHSLNQYI